MSAARPRGVLQIARVFGVPVLLAPSWFVFALWIVLLYQPLATEQVGRAGAYGVGAALALMLLGSVLLHEVAHCAVARAFALPVRSITVSLLSGRTEITEAPQTPAREYAIAISGPLVSLLLTGIGTAAMQWFADGSLARELAFNLAFTNGAITALNLLPGLPLDGGRVLRSALWQLGGDPQRATRVAARIGVVVGTVVVPVVLLGVLPLAGFSGEPVLMRVRSVIVGLFIVTGARASLRHVELTARLPELSVATLARPALGVPASMPLAEAIRQAHEQSLRAIVITGGNGQPAGIVSEAWVRQVPPERRPWVAAADGARKVEAAITLDPALTGEALLAAMSANPASEYLVRGDTPLVLVSGDVAAAMST